MDKNSKSSNKIGIFDSGVGGLTVMRAIQALLPQEEILYYADTANLPYGDKSPEEIRGYLTQALDFFSTQHIKLLIIACHTACATALHELRTQSPIPIIVILEQGVEQLCSYTSATHLAILATQTTLSTGVYQNLVHTHLPHTQLTAIACPQFVPLIQEGYISHPLTELAVHETLKPLKDLPLDAILLACTHYPLLKPAILHELGKDTPLLDPADSCALSTQAWLDAHHLSNTSTATPQHQFYVTAHPEKFQTLGSRFLNTTIEHVTSLIPLADKTLT